MDNFDTILAETEKEFPMFRMVPKRAAWHQRFVDKFLKVITFGKMSSYMVDYVSTIGQTIYIPEDWMSRGADRRAITLAHERVHMRQFRRYGFFLMMLLYVLFPLPIGLAYFRMVFERTAYEESMYYRYKFFGEKSLLLHKRRTVDQFVGPAYFWMWPFRKSVEKWYEEYCDKLMGEEVNRD